MKRFAFIALLAALVLSGATAVLAHTLTHEWVQIALEGPYVTQKTGVRLGDLMVKFSDQGLEALQYRFTPLRGAITLLDVTVVQDGKAIYRRSQTHAMNINLNWLLNSKDQPSGAVKHYQESMAFDKPIPGFEHEKGEIVFNVLAEGKKYNVVWRMKDNEFETKEVVDNPPSAAAPAAAPAATPAPAAGK